MKSLLVLCLVGVLVALSLADTKVHERGCVYILGRCKEPCPEGTHAYSTGCGQKRPEPTCNQPNPELEDGIICDYSSCYCDPPTVRDPKTKKCVQLEQCFEQEKKEDKEVQNEEEKKVENKEEENKE